MKGEKIMSWIAGTCAMTLLIMVTAAIVRGLIYVMFNV